MKTTYKGCLTPFCSCRNIDSNQDFLQCEDKFQQIYLQCIVGCPHDDYLCLPNCNRDYEINLRDCPCQENCPNGCPCPNYTCGAAPPVVQNKTVLILNSYDEWRPAMLINGSGKRQELSCFEHDDISEAYKSCSLVWENQLYIYGSRDHKRQISKLNKYHLQIVGTLPFNLQRGTCTNMAGRKLFLCFDYDDGKQCHWSTNPLGDFQPVSKTSYYHCKSRISSSNCKLILLSPKPNEIISGNSCSGQSCSG